MVKKDNEIPDWCDYEGRYKMDKIEFINTVAEVFEECKTVDEINGRVKEMIAVIEQQQILNIGYLVTGIL